MSTTEKLAAYGATTQYRDLPDDVIQMTKMMILDELCCAVLGRTHASGDLIQRYVLSLGGQPEATLVATPYRSTTALAALANSTSADADEFTGSHIQGGHLQTAVAHAAAATAEAHHATGEELITACVLGIDVAARAVAAAGGLHRMRNVYHLHSDFLCSYGAAASAARLMRLDEDAFRHAWALASFQSNALCAFFDERRHLSKSFAIGQAAYAGVSGAVMASFGFEGSDDIFGGYNGFLAAWGVEDGERLLTHALGSDYAVMGLHFKIYNAGYPTHGPIEATEQIMNEDGLACDDISSIEVGMPSEALKIVDGRQMSQICVQDMVAFAALSRNVGFQVPPIPPRALQEEEFRRLRSLVTAFGSAEMDTRDPNGRGAIVRITDRTGTVHERMVEYPKGHAMRRDITWDQIVEEKWRSILNTLIGSDRATSLIEMVAELENLNDVAVIMGLLRVDVA